MKGPGRTVREDKALYGHVLAMMQEQKPWPARELFHALLPPPVLCIRPAVDPAGSADQDVFHIKTADDADMGPERISLPGAQVVIILLIRRLNHPRQQRKRVLICTGKKDRALVEVQPQVAFQEETAEAVRAGRHQDPAQRGADGDRGLDGQCVI